MTEAKRRFVPRVLRGLFAVSAGLAVLCALLLTAAYGFYRLAPAGPQSGGGPNAVWAAHKWVGESHPDETYDALAATLQRNGITDVYFHVGPLDGDGLIPRAKYRNAPALLTALRTRDRSIRLHAWIGQVERRGGGPLDLSDVALRLDQVAVMMYDTASPRDWLYGAIVAYETWRLAGIAGPDTTLFMGVPTEEGRRWGFNPDAENMRSGLRGIRIGRHYAGAPEPGLFGAAVYAGWTTDESEWAVWRREWLGQQ